VTAVAGSIVSVGMPGPHFTEPVDHKARSGCGLGRFPFRAAPPAPAFPIPPDGASTARPYCLVPAFLTVLWTTLPETGHTGGGARRGAVVVAAMP